MSVYLGDFPISAIIDRKFNTRTSTQAPVTFSGSPTLAVYKNNETAEQTFGITLTVDFDSRTGSNHVRIDLTVGDGYYAGSSDYHVVVTSGTVDGISVVGETLFSFSIQNRSALRPTTSGRTLTVTASGSSAVDWATVENPSSTVSLPNTTIGTATNVTKLGGVTVYTYDGTLAAATSSSVTFPALNAAGTSIPNDARYEYGMFRTTGGTGPEQTVLTTTRVGATREFNVFSGSMPVTCGVDTTYIWLGSWRAAASVWGGTVGVGTTILPGSIPVATAAGAAGGLFIAGTNAATTVTTAFTTTFTGSLTGNVAGSIGSVTGAVGSVTGAVGSVTGAVGSVAAGGITAASFGTGAIDNNAIATDAIGASELAASATTEIATGVWDRLRSLSATAGTFGAVSEWATGGSGGGATAAQFWDYLSASASTANSMGKLIVDNLNATITSRSTYAGGAVASVTASVTVGTNQDKTGYKLAADGLDTISTTAPAGMAGNFREMVVALWRYFYRRTVYDKVNSNIKNYADNGTTVLATRNVTSNASADDIGAAS